jgi:hypothetical protein
VGRDVALLQGKLLALLREHEVHEGLGALGVLGALEDRDRLGHGGDALLREHELDRGALGLLADRHEVHDDPVELLAARDALEDVAVAAAGGGGVVLEALVVLPPARQGAGERRGVDQRGAGIERARHGDLALGLRLQEVGPGGRLEGRLGVVGDARGDELRREPVLLRVVGAGGIGRDVGTLVRQQPALLLEALHGDAVGDEEKIGLGLARLELRAQLGEDAGRPVAHEGDVHLRVLGLEGVEGLLGVGVGLARVEDELAGDLLGRDRGGRRARSAESNRRFMDETTSLAW